MSYIEPRGLPGTRLTSTKSRLFNSLLILGIDEGMLVDKDAGQVLDEVMRTYVELPLLQA